MNRIAALLCIALALSPRAALAAGADACIAAVPASLVQPLRAKFPGYRLPTRSDEARDLPKAAFDSLRRSCVNGCVYVAAGDFDGSGRKGFALLLARDTPSTEARPVRLVVARREGSQWSIEELPAWCSGIGGCYVASVGPGTYRRSTSMSPPTEPGDRMSLTLKRGGIASGTVEATSVVYSREGARWVYVWTSQ